MGLAGGVSSVGDWTRKESRVKDRNSRNGREGYRGVRNRKERIGRNGGGRLEGRV